MLQIRDLHYAIGARDLISGIQWVIQPARRAALIGRNGAGKTTLLRILAGRLQPNSGEILKPKDYRIGYLPQEEMAAEEAILLNHVIQGHQTLIHLEKEITDIHTKLEAQTGKHESLLNRLGQVEAQFDMLGGYRLEADGKAVLSGLGFQKSDFLRPLTEFSGGWRMRAYLARLLIEQPDLLLLDEPTNHLDQPSLEWLEQYLTQFSGSMVIVSHDRFFIDRLADEIFELESGKLSRYAGKYHFYESEKEKRRKLLLKQQKSIEKERKRQQAFIDRFRYKVTKAAQVQSQIKKLERQESIEVVSEQPHLDFRLSVETPSYKDVVHIRHLDFRYDSNWVFRNLSLNIYRGERLALVGKNGAGKTTLTRLITQQLVPQAGSAELGQRVMTGYYAQHQIDALNPDNTVFEEAASTASTSRKSRIRDVLGMFQFSGDTVEKPIRVLSGGEKARVSLAKILLSPVNFLIMDEPTNHLDMVSKEALERALSGYEGTLLLIAHDRYFLNKLVSRVLELEDGRLQIFEGNYSDYLNKKFRNAKAQQRMESKTGDSFQPLKKSKEQTRQEAEARQAVSRERNELQKEVERLEQRILQLEEKKSGLESELAKPGTYQNSEKSILLNKEYGAVKNEIEACYDAWDSAQAALEKLLEQIAS